MSGKLSPVQRTKWAQTIFSAAYSLYLVGDSRAAKCLRVAALLSPRLRTLLLAGAASLGISRARVKQIAALAGLGESATGTQK